MKIMSKLPKKVRDSLAKQMKTLFTGKVEKIKLNINLTIPISVGYGWAEDAKASYNRLDDGKDISIFYSLTEKNLQKVMRPKLNKVNANIKKFYQRLDKVCTKYNTDSDDEFNWIVNEYNLNDCNRAWY